MNRRTRRKLMMRALMVLVLGAATLLIAYGFVPKPVPVLLAPGWAQVKSGLVEHERVILYPSDRVGPGVKVTSRNAER